MYPEKEPLGAPAGIHIFLNQKIVLVLLTLSAYCVCQVSTLEPALEYKIVRVTFLSVWGAGVVGRFLIKGLEGCKIKVVVLGVVPTTRLIEWLCKEVAEFLLW